MNTKHYVIRLVFIGLAIMIYFFALKPLRIIAFDNIYLPVIEQRYSENYQKSSSVGVDILFSDENLVHLKIPFGRFFLLSLIVLIGLKSDKKFFGLLLLLHAAGAFVLFLSLLVPYRIEKLSLIVIDLTSMYLIPVFSFFIIPLSIINCQLED